MGRIPNELYEELAYIESTGTQYINPNLTIGDTFIDETDCLITSTSEGYQGSYNRGQRWGVYTGKIAGYERASDIPVGGRHQIEFKSGYGTGYQLYIDGVLKIDASRNTNTFQRYLLFVYDYNDGTGSMPLRMRMYSCKLTRNGVLERDFVPCRRKDTGVIGLLDLVNYDFYTNSGIGTFGYGLLVESEVSPLNSGTVSGTGTYLPGDNVTLTATANSGYEFEKWELNDYYVLTAIESTGTQYIDTGIKPSDYLNNLRIEGDMAFASTPEGNTSMFLFGAGYYNSTIGYRRTITCGYNQALDRTHVTYLNGAQMGSGESFINSTLDTQRRIYGIDQVNSNYIFGNETQSFTTDINSNLNSTIVIFAARNSSQSGTPVFAYSSAKCYGFKIYNGNILLRNFIPVIQKGTIEFGLLDLVEMKFYKNSGTGTFRAYEPDPSTDVVITDNPLSLPNLQNSFELTAYFKSIANCRYKVNGTWKNGTMYIKENGTWKSGAPKIKVNGAWKEGG